MNNENRKVNIEILKREQAFQLYKKLGSVKQIAELPGMPSYNTLLKWKEEDKWDERIKESQQKLQEWEFILSKLENDSLLKDDVMHLMLLNKLLEKTIKAIVIKDLEPQTWKEAMETLKIIFEQKRILLGRSTSKTEVDIDFSSLDEAEIRESLRKINSLLQTKGSSLSGEEQIKRIILEEVSKTPNEPLELPETSQNEESEEIDISRLFSKNT